jgi:hypothetical protein
MTIGRHSFFKVLTALLLSLVTVAAISGSSERGLVIKDLKFTRLGKWSSHEVEVAASTKQVLYDKDGTVYVGAIFRMTPAEPQTVDKLTAKAFVNVIIAPCDSNNVVLAHSTIIGVDGKEYPQKIDPQIYQVDNSPRSSSTVAYRYLCRGIGSVTPFGPALRA